jgi:hypothetical protein
VFGIEQPSKGRIVEACATVDVLRALMLDVVVVGHHAGWDKRRIQGTFVKQALSNDRDDCPPRFVRYAKLTPDEWRALWRASRGDGAGMTPALDAVIAEWVEDFGEMFPNGPFGDDDPVAVANALQRLADEQDKYAREHAPVPTPPMSVEESMAHGYTMVKGDGDTISVAQAWANALSELQLQLTGATYDTWLSRSRAVTFQDGVFTIGVHNNYAKDWLENRLLTMVKRALCSVTNLTSVEVQFVVFGSPHADRLAIEPACQEGN